MEHIDTDMCACTYTYAYTHHPIFAHGLSMYVGPYLQYSYTDHNSASAFISACTETEVQSKVRI